jgi:hypothetical protein
MVDFHIGQHFGVADPLDSTESGRACGVEFPKAIPMILEIRIKVWLCVQLFSNIFTVAFH